MKIFFVPSVLVVACVGICASVCAADDLDDAVAEFMARPGYLIDDDVLQDTSPSQMSAVRGVMKGSMLRYLHTGDVDGQRRPARDIIWLASNTYRINPKAIACLLQREQSLMTDQNVSWNQLNWALGYGVCDSCSRTHPKVRK